MTMQQPFSFVNILNDDVELALSSLQELVEMPRDIGMRAAMLGTASTQDASLVAGRCQAIGLAENIQTEKILMGRVPAITA